jgi:hypothetical protein
MTQQTLPYLVGVPTYLRDVPQEEGLLPLQVAEQLNKQVM